MSLSSFRRRSAPVALLTYASFFAGLFPRTAYAEEPPPPALTPALGDAELGPVEKAKAVATPPSVSGTNADVGKTTLEADPAKLKLDAKAEEKIESTLTPPSTGEVVPTGLPTGADKTGVSSQAISVPQGTGKIQGMGESFSAQLSTGIATFSVPIALPSARGAAQPSVGLSYSSSAGHGNAGVGWDVGWPYIARQTDRGLPRYATLGATEAWKPDQDRFVFNGGQELVPICRVNGGACAGALPGEAMPTWADGWRYFRPRVEGGFLRFFWSPDGKTWRVQDKGGVTMEIGVPLDGSGYTGALETDPANASRVFRWNLARQFDQESAGSQPAPLDAPVNIVVYRYSQDGGMAYLTDVYDTTPVSAPTTSALSTYAHHTRLRWEPRTDPTESWRRGWKTVSGLRLRGVDVASKGYVGASDARELVRRYHLAYEPGSHVSLLASVQVEGRCTDASGIVTITPEGAGEGFADATNCPRLPPMRFGYAHVTPYKTDGSPGSADLPGYEGFDERVITMAASPDHSLDEELTDLFDVNADGLPDVLVTAPGLYGGKHGVFVNGGGGTPNAFTQRTMDVLGVLGADTNTITLKNGNVSPQDLDGDGVIDFLHMPNVKTYSVYTPDTSGLQWAWKGREITTASQQSPKIDFGKDASRTRVVDVNGDGLVDVLVSSGTRYQTFFALGRLPNGDGQFGNGAWTSRDSAAISNEPVATCVPWAGSPVQLDDPDVRLGDMNGDGLADLVRIRHGDIRYWPGRGNGFFGTGALDDCPADTFGSDRHVMMATSPNYSDVNLDGIRLDDVNGDGLDDLVQIRFDAVDVWLNVDGKGWTADRHIIEKSPYSPSFQSRTRLVDVNGSGTRDILWGDGNAYKYIDLLGGARPWVMTRVENGLGKTTDLEYASSTSLMLAAEKAGDGWKRKAPMPLHVVVRTTERDHLNLVNRPEGVYVTEYTYRDPVYDGRQREFRGFSETQVRKVGDANSPTSVETSQFLLGECVIEGKPCTIANRWMDNPREALKGLPVVVSSRAEATGEVLSTGHHTYRLRRLYKGLDERDVYHAFESGSQSFLYDVAAFVPAASTVHPPELELEDAATGGSVTTSNGSVTVATGATGRATVEGTVEVDVFGNKTVTTARGCVDCAPKDPVIVSHTEAGRPAGDKSGWLWRTTHSWVEGEGGAKLHETYAAFDARGRPTTTKAELSGNLPLDRHPTLGIADAPMASSAGPITMSSAEAYDVFGHALTQLGANQRCRKVDYDTAYADLVTSETIYVGANCTGEELTTFAGYDRGLEQVTSVTGMNGEQSLAVYDGFGRITSLHKPLPDGSIPTVHPSVRITYLLPSDPAKTPYARIHTETQDGATPEDAEYLESWGYVDGMGRPIVSLSEADPTSDGDAWVVSGYTFYDAKGAVAKTCLPWFYGGDPSAYPLGTAPPTDCKRQTYDAFGRGRQAFTYGGLEVLRTVQHALSSDAWDAEDLAPFGGTHANTPASVRKDGHGRTVQTTERIKVGQTLEERYVTTTYLPTGEPAVITRSRNPWDGVSTRWMRYDSLGRMVLNVEPSTTRHFSADPTTATPGAPTADTDLRAWRYAYSDSGDLVGTSDARQCGANFHYDGAGRLVAEDFSPCEGDHQAYSEPVLATGYGAEAQYIYGTVAPAKGRLVTVRDRGATTTTTYDYRGRATHVERQLAKPGVPSVDPDTRYAPSVYTQTMEYDGADRPTTQSTGAATTQLLSPTSTSTVTSVYSARGTIKRVDSAYGMLVSAVVRDAEGKTVSVTYGDAASTTTSTTYDVRRRVASVQTGRQAPAMWGTGSYPGGPWTTNTPTFQTTLEHTAFTYDDADNPLVIEDLRDASAWPAGAKPVTRTMTYDDLYRVVGLQYAYAAGDDTWVSPFDAENTGTPDPRRAKPSPHVKFDKRMLSQSRAFDWVGNTTSTDDDAHGFYDRSLGTVTNDGYRLTAATQAGAKGGSLDTAYDDAGNLTGMRVVRSAADCLPVGATCSQRYAYAWDEIGRLVRARRWDMPNPPAAGQPPPSTTAEVELRYAYDATDDRVLKTAVDPAGNEVHTAYVFDSLELRRAPWEDVGGAVFDYRRDEGTEVAYLSAHGVRLARLVYEDGGVPEVVAGHKLHVFFELGDHLGSTSTVLDKDTGELVEKGTFQAYGGAESDYRPERWKAFREDYRFTGKEEDVEVGLTYFGKRFLSPALGRWVSADPLTVHGLGADANAYAYVHGRALRMIDPVGLTIGEFIVGMGAGVLQSFNPIPAPLLAAAGAKPPPGPPHEELGRVFGEGMGGAVQILAGLVLFGGGGRLTLSGGGAAVGVPVAAIGGLLALNGGRAMGQALGRGLSLSAGSGSRTGSATPPGRTIATSAPEPGAWTKAPPARKFSERARAYQEQITGRGVGEEYVVKGPDGKEVFFDGFRDGKLLDAKGPGYARLLDDKNRKWSSAPEQLIEEATRQVKAANGTKIEWHFAEKEAADTVGKMLNNFGFGGKIEVIHTAPAAPVAPP